jgi:hypothetical protein
MLQDSVEFLYEVKEFIAGRDRKFQNDDCSQKYIDKIQQYKDKDSKVNIQAIRNIEKFINYYAAAIITGFTGLMHAYEEYISSAISKDEFFYDYFSEVAFAGKTLPDLYELRIKDFSLEGDKLYLNALNAKFPIKIKNKDVVYTILDNVYWDVNCFKVKNTISLPIGAVDTSRTSKVDVYASVDIQQGEYVARYVRIDLRYNIDEKYSLVAKYNGLHEPYVVETYLAAGNYMLFEYDRNEQKLRTDRLYIKCGNTVVEDIPSTQGYYHELDFYDLKDIVETYFI